MAEGVGVARLLRLPTRGSTWPAWRRSLNIQYLPAAVLERVFGYLNEADRHKMVRMNDLFEDFFIQRRFELPWETTGVIIYQKEFEWQASMTEDAEIFEFASPQSILENMQRMSHETLGVHIQSFFSIGFNVTFLHFSHCYISRELINFVIGQFRSRKTPYGLTLTNCLFEEGVEDWQLLPLCTSVFNLYGGRRMENNRVRALWDKKEDHQFLSRQFFESVSTLSCVRLIPDRHSPSWRDAYHMSLLLKIPEVVIRVGDFQWNDFFEMLLVYQLDDLSFRHSFTLIWQPYPMALKRICDEDEAKNEAFHASRIDGQTLVPQRNCRGVRYAWRRKIVPDVEPEYQRHVRLFFFDRHVHFITQTVRAMETFNLEPFVWSDHALPDLHWDNPATDSDPDQDSESDCIVLN